MSNKKGLARKVILGFLIVFVILIGVLIAIPVIYKDDIEAAVKEEVNKNLNAEVNWNDFGLTFLSTFPQLTFIINDFTIANKAPFEGDTLANIGEFKIALDLMSVLKGEKIKINGIEVNNSKIKALVLEDGTANWDITIDEEVTEEEESGSNFAIGLQRYEINNADVIYDDRSLNVYMRLSNFNHEGQGDFTQDLFVLQTLSSSVQLTFSYEGIPYLKDVKPDIKCNLEMDLSELDKDIMKFTFKDNEVRINNLIIGVDGFYTMKGDDMEMDITFGAKETNFKDLLSILPGMFTEDFEDVKAEGSLAFNGYVKGTYNEKQMPGFDINMKVDNGRFQYPDLPKAVEDIQIDVAVKNSDGVPDNTIINLKKFNMRLGNNPFSARMLLTNPESDPNIDADIKGKVDLADVNQMFPVEGIEDLSGILTSDVSLAGKMSYLEAEMYDQFKANGNISLSNFKYSNSEYFPKPLVINQMNMEFTPKIVTLSHFDMVTGGSDVQASGELSNFLPYALKDETLYGKLNLTGNSLNFSDMMADEETETTEGEEEPLEVIPLPENIDFVMTSSIGKMIYDGVEYKNIKGVVALKDQVATLSGLSMEVFEGNIIMDGLYTTKDPEKPAFDLTLDMNHLDIPKAVDAYQVISEYAKVAQHTSGKFSTDVKASGTLKQDMMPDYGTLNAKGRLQLENAKISNYGVLSKLADVIKQPKYKELNLNDVNISYEIIEGRLYVDPFDYKLDNTKMTVSGSSGVDQSLDFLVNMDIPRKEFGGAANQALEGLAANLGSKGVPVDVGDIVKLDVAIGGTADNPKIVPKFRGTEGGGAKEQLKGKASEELEQQKQKAKEELERKRLEAEQKLKEEEEKAKREAEERMRREKEKAREELEKEKDKAKEDAKDKIKNIFKKPGGG